MPCRPKSKSSATLSRWFDTLCNYHVANVANGQTEPLDNLIKRTKWIGFGFRNLASTKPNWRVLASIVVL